MLLVIGKGMKPSAPDRVFALAWGLQLLEQLPSNLVLILLGVEIEVIELVELRLLPRRHDRALIVNQSEVNGVTHDGDLGFQHL